VVEPGTALTAEVPAVITQMAADSAAIFFFSRKELRMAETKESIKLQDFSLKGFKTFRGMEGQGFNATLMLNKKEVAFVADDATGGEPRIEWKEGHWKAPEYIQEFLASPECVKLAVEREEAFRKEYGFGTDTPLPTAWDPSDFIEYLVDRHESEKQCKRMAKNHGLIFRPTNSDPNMFRHYQLPKGQKLTKEYVDKLVARAEKEFGNIDILARYP